MAESRYEKEGGWEIVLSGAGKGEGRKPVEDPESLRSRSEATIVGVMSEGEVYGFEPGVDPLTKIFLDGSQLKTQMEVLTMECRSFSREVLLMLMVRGI